MRLFTTYIQSTYCIYASTYYICVLIVLTVYMRLLIMCPHGIHTRLLLIYVSSQYEDTYSKQTYISSTMRTHIQSVIYGNYYEDTYIVSLLTICMRLFTMCPHTTCSRCSSEEADGTNTLSLSLSLSHTHTHTHNATTQVSLYYCMCPQAAAYMSSCYCICVLILLHVSSYYCICVLILLHVSSYQCIRGSVGGHMRLRARSSCFLCVFILLHMCRHTTACVLILVHVSSCYCICVLIQLHMCPHQITCALEDLYNG